MVGAFAGTSTVTSYIESSSGVIAGARSGVSTLVVGLLFLLSMSVIFIRVIFQDRKATHET